LLQEEYARQPDGEGGLFLPQNVFGSPGVGMDDSNPKFAVYADAMDKYVISMAQRKIQFLLEVKAWKQL